MLARLVNCMQFQKINKLLCCLNLKMVKIVDKSLEEKLKYKKFDKFIDVAAEVTGVNPKFMKKHSVLDHSFLIYSNGLHVYPQEREVVVYGDDNFDVAKTLAEKYESMTNEEFTLTKKCKDKENWSY